MKGITLFDHQATRFTKVEVNLIADGFEFTEGPLWHPDGFLLFSDIPANKIYKLEGGSTSVYLEPSGFTGTDRALLHEQIGSNGLTFDRNGSLLVCQHGDHRIARYSNGGLIAVTDNFEGKPYNSPNDIVVSKNGVIYFTDPPYGLKEQVLNKDKFQPVGGVYMHRDGQTQLICSELQYPNGLAFSPDGKFLYISTNHTDEPVMLRYTVNEQGELGEKLHFMSQNADGLEVDSEGNIYMATEEGVMIANSDGQKLALIPLDETPTNLAWEGSAFTKLYVTASSHLYSITFNS